MCYVRTDDYCAIPFILFQPVNNMRSSWPCVVAIELFIDLARNVAPLTVRCEPTVLGGRAALCCTPDTRCEPTVLGGRAALCCTPDSALRTHCARRTCCPLLHP